MKAAVVTTFGRPPRYADAPEPSAPDSDHVVVEVAAAALSPRVRSQAAGSHYTSTDELPLTPGIDGVGRLPDGTLVYFLLPDTNNGAMAQRIVVDIRRTVTLPRQADPVAVAAAMNPAMASWVALRQRITAHRGHSVLILGATGNAGRAAMAVARHLGAGRVIAVGRNIDRVAGLGADRLIELDAAPATAHRELADAGADIDVVLDFLWGEPTDAALRAIVPNRTDDQQLLSWVQIGSVAGPEATIPSAALRAVNLQLIGSGQGSVDPRAYRTEVATLAEEVANGAFAVPTRAIPLSRVESAWSEPPTAERIVIVP